MVLKVQTKYKEEMPLRAEDKPKRELSISEWLHAMSDAGFDGLFKAVMGDIEYKGEIGVHEDGKGWVKSKRVPKADEVRARIEQLKKS